MSTGIAFSGEYQQDTKAPAKNECQMPDSFSAHSIEYVATLRGDDTQFATKSVAPSTPTLKFDEIESFFNPRHFTKACIADASDNAIPGKRAPLLSDTTSVSRSQKSINGDTTSNRASKAHSDITNTNDQSSPRVFKLKPGPASNGGTLAKVKKPGNIKTARQNIDAFDGVICFTPGTMIATPRGARDVATLGIGELIVTRDHGLQPVRWISSCTVPALHKFAPIRIRPGVVTGLETDIVVSARHRMLFQGYRAELLFGESEVLVAAEHLVDGILVTREPTPQVTYINIMFDQHEVIFAEGAATESFHPAQIDLKTIADTAREELFNSFPWLRSDVSHYGQTARRYLRRRESMLLGS